MDEEILDEIKEQTSAPLEVSIKKEKETPPPSFDYDDYSPTDEEILEIETEISDQIKKRTKNG